MNANPYNSPSISAKPHTVKKVSIWLLAKLATFVTIAFFGFFAGYVTCFVIESRKERQRYDDYSERMANDLKRISKNRAASNPQP